jgi:Leucine-rich repeat (LRR) protein
LGANYLTGLPPEIGQLASLEFLDLQGNDLTGFPPELSQLTNLQDLVLYQNPLESIPPEVCANVEFVFPVELCE